MYTNKGNAFISQETSCLKPWSNTPANCHNGIDCSLVLILLILAVAVDCPSITVALTVVCR